MDGRPYALTLAALRVRGSRASGSDAKDRSLSPSAVLGAAGMHCG